MAAFLFIAFIFYCVLMGFAVMLNMESEVLSVNVAAFISGLLLLPAFVGSAVIAAVVLSDVTELWLLLSGVTVAALAATLVICALLAIPMAIENRTIAEW